MVLCIVVVANTYPVSRRSDYVHPHLQIPGSVSVFHYNHPIPFDPQTQTFNSRQAQRSDKGLMAGFDSHFVSVSQKNQMQAVDTRDYDFDEVVVKEKQQVLPIAVVYFSKSESWGRKRSTTTKPQKLMPRSPASYSKSFSSLKNIPSLTNLKDIPEEIDETVDDGPLEYTDTADQSSAFASVPIGSGKISGTTDTTTDVGVGKAVTYAI